MRSKINYYLDFLKMYIFIYHVYYLSYLNYLAFKQRTGIHNEILIKETRNMHTLNQLDVSFALDEQSII